MSLSVSLWRVVLLLCLMIMYSPRIWKYMVIFIILNIDIVILPDIVSTRKFNRTRKIIGRAMNTSISTIKNSNTFILLLFVKNWKLINQYQFIANHIARCKIVINAVDSIFEPICALFVMQMPKNHLINAKTVVHFG